MLIRTTARLRRALRALARDERGAAVAAVAILTVGLLMTFGLVADAGRAYSERARLQAWLDSLAVAVAAQLDGRDDAIARAVWIADNAGIAAAAAYSAAGAPAAAPDVAEAEAGAVAYEVTSIRFLREAPALTGLEALTPTEIAALETTDPREAAFALLAAAPRNLRFSALSLVSGDATGFAIAARSVAMPVPRAACRAPAIAICAPADRLGAMSTPGAQLRVRKALDGLWEAGEYGLILPDAVDPDGPCAGFAGAEAMTCRLAAEAVAGACPASVALRAGDGVDVSAALNTRFDIWADGAAHLRASPDFASDANTISGALHACDGPLLGQVSDSMGLPDDPCFHLGTCDFVSPPPSRDALELYWTQTHGGALPAGLATRYEVYAHELFAGLLDPEGPEDSTLPACNPAAAPAPGRRLIDVALVDCTGLAGLQPGRAPVVGQVETLMTVPADPGANAIATFDGTHENAFMQPGDIPRQSGGPGNPGNGKAVGGAGETPNGEPCWGSGSYGMSDAEACDDPLPWPPEDARVTDSRGRLTYDPYRALGLMRIDVKRSVASNRADWRNVPMLFDTANPTGGDSDLASTRFGNVLIVSEDGDADDPDDEALGGWLLFHFDRPTRIESLIVFDTEEGGVIRLYGHVETDPTGEFRTRADGTLQPLRSGEIHDPDELRHVAVPRLGDGRHVRVAIGTDAVRTLAYFLPDSGAVDDLVFSNDLTDPIPDDRLSLEVVRVVGAAAGQWSVIFD